MTYVEALSMAERINYSALAERIDLFYGMHAKVVRAALPELDPVVLDDDGWDVQVTVANPWLVPSQCH